MFDLVLSAASFCINLLPIIYFRLKFFLSKCMFLSFFLSCSFISFVYLLLFFFLSYLFRFWSHTDSHCHNFSIFVVTDMKSYYLHSTFRTSYISLTQREILVLIFVIKGNFIFLLPKNLNEKLQFRKFSHLVFKPLKRMIEPFLA